MPIRYVPNALTIGRIVVTPLLLAFLLTGTAWGQVTAFALFVVAAISDYLDGKLAREFSVRSRLGQFLDPFADKILVLGTFAALALLYPNIVPWWAVGLIALRDVAVTILRSWMEARGRTLKTSRWAKYKTLFQLVFLIGMLLLISATHIQGWGEPLGRFLRESQVPFYVLLVAVAVTWATGIAYFLGSERDEAPIA
jgi:CDP-diacylglycerol--glycerol-3-phosphate 3-phosphatidyltransferase